MKVVSISILLLVLCHFQTSLTKYSRTLKKCKKVGIHSTKEHRMFLKFIRKFDKDYRTPSECSTRLQLFHRSMKRVRHLRKNEKGSAVYGVTQFSDMSRKEFKRYTGGRSTNYTGPLWRTRLGFIPSRWDWRTRGILNPPVDQLNCGACFSFATVANAEAMLARRYRKLYKLSEQQIVDCDVETHACTGGTSFAAAMYIIRIGLMQAFHYPYVARKQKCRYKKRLIIRKPNTYIAIDGNERRMAQFVYQKGPIVAFINSKCIKDYRGGIIYNTKCPGEKDHNVLIVGYGRGRAANGRIYKYWIIRNSWGRWGENGYFRLIRDVGAYGINSFAVSVLYV